MSKDEISLEDQLKMLLQVGEYDEALHLMDTISQVRTHCFNKFCDDFDKQSGSTNPTRTQHA